MKEFMNLYIEKVKSFFVLGQEKRNLLYLSTYDFSQSSMLPKNVKKINSQLYLIILCYFFIKYRTRIQKHFLY